MQKINDECIEEILNGTDFKYARNSSYQSNVAGLYSKTVEIDGVQKTVQFRTEFSSLQHPSGSIFGFEIHLGSSPIVLMGAENNYLIGNGFTGDVELFKFFDKYAIPVIRDYALEQMQSEQKSLNACFEPKN